MEEQENTLDFLGREFLTWLWYKSEERGGSVNVPAIGDVVIEFIQRVVLESGEGEYSESVQCQGRHSTLREGLAALREGKKVKEARIQLEKGDFQWEFTFKADEFRFQSLKLPQMMSITEETESAEGRVLERIALIREITETMDALFNVFLSLRCEPDWTERELPHMQKWIKSAGD